jgi:hypothetical protein
VAGGSLSGTTMKLWCKEVTSPLVCLLWNYVDFEFFSFIGGSELFQILGGVLLIFVSHNLLVRTATPSFCRWGNWSWEVKETSRGHTAG